MISDLGGGYKTWDIALVMDTKSAEFTGHLAKPQDKKKLIKITGSAKTVLNQL